MTATNSPADALAKIPGWVGAEFKPLHGGLNNTSYKVRNANQTAVLKIDSQPRTDPFNTRELEASIQGRAHDANLAAQVLHVSESAYLVEYVSGAVWSASDLHKYDSLARLAKALKSMHALPLSGRSFDAVAAANRYTESIAMPDRDIVKLCRYIVDSFRFPHNLCLCHNDLVAANIVATPKIVFLDWEYACDNDPFFDLATVIEHHELSDTRANFLLEAYAGAGFARWQERLGSQRKLYLALLWLWLASRDDGDNGELDRVAARLVTSCS